MVITGGTVEFSRTIKPADYESKGAKVVLSFGVDEGEDTQGVLERVSTIAMRHALSMVGASRELPAAPVASLQTDVAEALGNAGKPRRQPWKPVDPASIEEVVETRPTDASSAELKSEPSAAIPENAGIVDPAAIEDIEEVPVEAAAIVISDKDLATACANAREEKGAKYDVMAVRKLIGEYAAPGIRMSEIAKEKRGAFLVALKAL